MQLLYQDLARRRELEGLPNVQPPFFLLLCSLLHPRVLPVVLCRASRWAMLHGVPVVPKLLTVLNIMLFGLEVSPRCEIGPGIFFPHTSGTVIGAMCIGSNATIFQGVTLGAKMIDMAYDPAMRPHVGDNVILGAGCKVLGGVTIGDDAVVGANSVVVESVAAGTTVVGIPARATASAARGER